MRKVKIFQYEQRIKESDGSTYFEKIERGIGRFHGWGIDYEDFDNCPGNYLSAIVELDDGTVETLPLALIQFIVIDKLDTVIAEETPTQNLAIQLREDPEFVKVWHANLAMAVMDASSNLRSRPLTDVANKAATLFMKRTFDVDFWAVER